MMNPNEPHDPTEVCTCRTHLVSVVVPGATVWLQRVGAVCWHLPSRYAIVRAVSGDDVERRRSAAQVTPEGNP